MRSILVLAMLVARAGMANAGSAPSAIVEFVAGDAGGVSAFDYLRPGQVIRLASDAKLTIGYLKSCQREMVTGGIVTVGDDASVVTGGTVERKPTACAGSLQLTAGQLRTSGAMVFRMERDLIPRITIYGTSPVIMATDPGQVVVERIDKGGERAVFTLMREPGRESAVIDLAAAQTPLTPGGIYRATGGGNVIEFKIDAAATPGAAPLVDRLIPLSSGSRTPTDAKPKK